MFVNRTSENFRNCNVERALIYIIATGEFDPQISVVCFFTVHVVRQCLLICIQLCLMDNSV